MACARASIPFLSRTTHVPNLISLPLSLSLISHLSLSLAPPSEMLSFTAPMRLTCCDSKEAKNAVLFCGSPEVDKCSVFYNDGRHIFIKCVVHKYEADLKDEHRDILTDKVDYPGPDSRPRAKFSGPYLQRKLKERIQEQGTDEEKKALQDLEDAKQRLKEATKKAGDVCDAFQAREKAKFLQELPNKCEAFAKEACCSACKKTQTGASRGLQEAHQSL